jgi:hypothetical protein
MNDLVDSTFTIIAEAREKGRKVFVPLPPCPPTALYVP